MNYYKQKTEVMNYIRQLAEEKFDLEDIQFAILEKYGFSEKFVESYYNKLVERGFVKKVKK